MNSLPESDDEDLDEYIDIWTIPLDAFRQGEIVPHHPAYSNESPVDDSVDDTPIIFQFPEIPFEGFHPRLKRFDESA